MASSSLTNNLRIRSLVLKNFKSIEESRIDFGPLTLLVGRNGVGKSNIVDALRFIADALKSNLGFAIRERGGINEVRRKSLGGRPTNPGLGITVMTDSGSADYSFRIAAATGGTFRVDHETCTARNKRDQVIAQFKIRSGHLTDWSLEPAAPPVAEDRLYLAAVAGYPAFGEVFDVLTRMTFHNLNPQVMRYPVRPEPGERLVHDGRNLPSVIKRLESQSPEQLQRVVAYLQALGIPITRIAHKAAASLETIQVSQEVPAPEGPKNLNFDAVALSDGTLRALGILVSLVSGRAQGVGPSLVAVEEPETALHPAAVGALVDALVEGSERTQTLVTCHSPDMLDNPAVTGDLIRVVLLQDAKTRVGPLDAAKSQLLRDHLFSAGELLRLDQLAPDQAVMDEQQRNLAEIYGAIG